MRDRFRVDSCAVIVRTLKHSNRSIVQNTVRGKKTSAERLESFSAQLGMPYRLEVASHLPDAPISAGYVRYACRDWKPWATTRARRRDSSLMAQS